MAGNLRQVAEWLSYLTPMSQEKSITIRDLAGIPEVVEPQACPLVSPDPDGFCSDVTFERLTFRAGVAGRKYKLDYLLHYLLFAAPATDGLTLFDTYADLANAWSAVITEIIENETPDGAYDVRPDGTPAFGPVLDPSGQLFHGARFTLRVTEFH